MTNRKAAKEDLAQLNKVLGELTLAINDVRRKDKEARMIYQRILEAFGLSLDGH